MLIYSLCARLLTAYVSYNFNHAIIRTWQNKQNSCPSFDLFPMTACFVSPRWKLFFHNITIVLCPHADQSVMHLHCHSVAFLFFSNFQSCPATPTHNRTRLAKLYSCALPPTPCDTASSVMSEATRTSHTPQSSLSRGSCPPRGSSSLGFVRRRFGPSCPHRCFVGRCG